MPLTESLSGVRGIWGIDLNEEIAARYASAYCSFLKKRIGKNLILAIGADTRPSGRLIKEAIFKSADCSLIDAGIAPTPAIQLAVREFNADGGIIITASHNEPEYNGFKFLRKDGAVLSDEDMSSVTAEFRKTPRLRPAKPGNKIMDRKAELARKYIDFIIGIIGKTNAEKIKKSNPRIILDPNGGTGFVARNILERLGASVIGINMEPGSFSRKVEPNEDSLFYLANTIEDEKADFAVGFDCDADRAELLLPKGRIVSGNYVLALACRYILSAINAKGKFVVVNDATSNAVRDVVESYGARIIEAGVGEISVVDEMIRNDAVLGGEGSSSGAIIPPSRCRDGILTAACILALVANEGKSLKSIIEKLPKYFTLRKKIEFKQENYDSIVRNINRHYSDKKLKIKSLNGSIKVAFGRGSFVWFRASKTEFGVFRIIADSDDEAEAKSLLQEAERVAKDAGN